MLHCRSGLWTHRSVRREVIAGVVKGGKSCLGDAEVALGGRLARRNRGTPSAAVGFGEGRREVADAVAGATGVAGAGVVAAGLAVPAALGVTSGVGATGVRRRGPEGLPAGEGDGGR